MFVLITKSVMMLGMAFLVMQVVPHTRTNEEMFSLLHIMQFMQEDLPPIVRRFQPPLCFVLLNSSPGGCRTSVRLYNCGKL